MANEDKDVSYLSLEEIQLELLTILKTAQSWLSLNDIRLSRMAPFLEPSAIRVLFLGTTILIFIYRVPIMSTFRSMLPNLSGQQASRFVRARTGNSIFRSLRLSILPLGLRKKILMVFMRAIYGLMCFRLTPSPILTPSTKNS